MTPEDLLHEIFGRRDGGCTTPDCLGDARYSAPGRGHREGCRYPLHDEHEETP